jgi:hypothetical protein
MRLPPRSPNLNAYAERCVRSIKEECLGRMILTAVNRSRDSLKTGGISNESIGNAVVSGNSVSLKSLPQRFRWPPQASPPRS